MLALMFIVYSLYSFSFLRCDPTISQLEILSQNVIWNFVDYGAMMA